MYIFYLKRDGVLIYEDANTHAALPEAAVPLAFDALVDAVAPIAVNIPDAPTDAGKRETRDGGAAISYYLKSAASGDVKITIADATGKVIRNIDGTKTAGINRVMWNLAPNPPPGPPPAGFGGGGRGGAPQAVDAGTYIVTLSVGGKTYTKPVSVLQDRWLGER